MVHKLESADEPLNDPYHRWDCERIVACALSNGYVMTLREAEKAWDEYSESFAAGWMNLPDDDEDLWLYIGSRIEEMAQGT